MKAFRNRILGAIIMITGQLATSVAIGQPAAQLTKSTHDFGTVRNWNNPPAIFRITNMGNSDLVFLPTQAQRDLLIKLPKRAIPPGGKGAITILYYTSRPGPFVRQVPIYTNASDQPLDLVLKGNITSIAHDADLACPTMGPKTDRRGVTEFQQMILVVDRSNGMPIPGADVTVVEQDQSKRYKTKGNGTVQEAVNLGFVDIHVKKTGYEPASKSGYINRNTGLVTIEMDPLQPDLPLATGEPVPIPPDDEPLDAAPEPIPPTPPVVAVPPTPEPVPEPTPPTSVPVEPEPPVAHQPVPPVVTPVTEPVPEPDPEPDPEPELVEGQLSKKRFHPNNIVFLIDVSSSMRPEHKLPLLKQSMKRLAEVLREEDQLTIVTYATRSEVVMPATAANQKAMINTVIDSLTAYGVTNSVRGLEQAYDLAKASFSFTGNNQIILATDGLFEKDPKFNEKEMLKQIKGKTEERIKLSVIGYGDDVTAIKRMQKMADLGAGHYLQINDPTDDTEVLVEEIKANSRKY